MATSNPSKILTCSDYVYRQGLEYYWACANPNNDGSANSCAAEGDSDIAGYGVQSPFRRLGLSEIVR